MKLYNIDIHENAPTSGLMNKHYRRKLRKQCRKEFAYLVNSVDIAMLEEEFHSIKFKYFLKIHLGDSVCLKYKFPVTGAEYAKNFIKSSYFLMMYDNIRFATSLRATVCPRDLNSEDLMKFSKIMKIFVPYNALIESIDAAKNLRIMPMVIMKAGNSCFTLKTYFSSLFCEI